MELIRNYIFKQVAEQKLSQQDAEAMLRELMKGAKDIHSDIAVIGMSGKYPNADNLEEFWDNIVHKRTAIRDFDESRKKDGEHMLPYPWIGEALVGVPINEENVYYPKAGYLKDGIDKFDAAFFNIPPKEATYMDPVHRLFLEVAWEALEDAGYGGDSIYGSNMGVYVGKDNTNISLYKHMTEKDAMHLTGSWAGILASRISYLFNLTGPSMVIDTACSSGLVCVHEACKALRNKECDTAIVGGVNIMYVTQAPKDDKVIMDLGIVESEDYTVRPFDDKANGTVWGEGVGALILKPLKAALRDGDHIHAIIKGSAINNDGASNGITAPNAVAQEDVIVKAWEDAEIDPETISYIEAHGTATNLGDPIEIKGLTQAFGRFTNKKQFCGIGSSKGSIGHIVAASGIAALTKVILAMKNKQLVPSSNFSKPNQYIDFPNSAVYVLNRLQEWMPNGSRRRAGVSSFGFSGTNCHVVVEEGPQYMPKEVYDGRPYIFTVSAKNDKVLTDYIEKYDRFFEINRDFSVQDVCSTVSLGRGHYRNRVALIVRSVEDIRNKLGILKEKGLQSSPADGIYYGKSRVISDNKKGGREDGDITESEKGNLEYLVNEELNGISQNEADMEEIIAGVCVAYIQGADIAWKKIYENQKIAKVSLPVYPLERTRYWAPSKEFSFKDLANKIKGNKVGHLLIDECVVETANECIYLTNFSAKDKWVIEEHKFLDNYVLPGIAYLELARKACTRFYTESNIELKDVVFMEALVVDADEVKPVHTIVRKESNHLEFSVVSKVDRTGNGENIVWATHAQGKAYEIPKDILPAVDIKLIRENCSKSKVDLNNDISKEEFTLGGRWDNITSIHLGENQEFVEITLNEKYHSDLEGLFIHPPMLDNAMNAVLLQIRNEIYLPFSYKDIKIYRQFPEKLFSNIRMKEDIQSGAEILSFDATLMDEEGNILAEVENYSIKKVRQSEQRKFEALAGSNDVYYKIAWKEQELKDDGEEIGNNVLILGSEYELAAEVANSLREKGKYVIEVNIGQEFMKVDQSRYVIRPEAEDFKVLMESLRDKEITEILHFTTLGLNGSVEDTDALEKCQSVGVYSLFHLTRAILECKLKQKIRLTLVSPCVDEVTGNEEVLNPQHAPMMGLGKVITQEYPNINCKSIDIDNTTTKEQIIGEISSKTIIYKTALRNGKRYIEEFDKADLDIENIPELNVAETGAYIITGGTGGLGLELAKHLSGKGAKNLALINRTQFADRDSWDQMLESGEPSELCKKIAILKEIEQTGTQIETISADVSNLTGMEAVITGLRNRYGRINGIVHCAGVAGDGYIVNKPMEVFKKVMLPKVNGTWVLDKLTVQDTLDFFVLFSSVTTFQSFPGQSDYTAANSYLDSFSAYGRRKNRNIMTINWPGWKETGMASDYKVNEAALAFKLIQTKKALKIFDVAVASGQMRLLAGDLNYQTIAQQRDQFVIRMSEELLKLVMKQMEKQSKGKGSVRNIEITLKGKTDGIYLETEKILGKVFGAVLGVAEIDIYDSFYDMGGDSILATQLFKEIDNIFPGKVDITDIFTYPSVEQMSQYIDHLNEDLSKNAEEDEQDKELQAMLDGVESGSISVESGLKKLN